jgi:hypothetical protein
VPTFPGFRANLQGGKGGLTCSTRRDLRVLSAPTVSVTDHPICADTEPAWAELGVSPNAGSAALSALVCRLDPNEVQGLVGLFVLVR